MALARTPRFEHFRRPSATGISGYMKGPICGRRMAGPSHAASSSYFGLQTLRVSVRMSTLGWEADANQVARKSEPASVGQPGFSAPCES